MLTRRSFLRKAGLAAGAALVALGLRDVPKAEEKPISAEEIEALIGDMEAMSDAAFAAADAVGDMADNLAALDISWHTAWIDCAEFDAMIQIPGPIRPPEHPRCRNVLVPHA